MTQGKSGVINIPVALVPAMGQKNTSLLTLLPSPPDKTSKQDTLSASHSKSDAGTSRAESQSECGSDTVDCGVGSHLTEGIEEILGENEAPGSSENVAGGKGKDVSIPTGDDEDGNKTPREVSPIVIEPDNSVPSKGCSPEPIEIVPQENSNCNSTSQTSNGSQGNERLLQKMLTSGQPSLQYDSQSSKPPHPVSLVQRVTDNATLSPQASEIIDLESSEDELRDVDILSCESASTTGSAAAALKKCLGIISSASTSTSGSKEVKAPESRKRKRKQAHEERNSMADDVEFREELVVLVPGQLNRNREQHVNRERQRRYDIVYKFEALKRVLLPQHQWSKKLPKITILLRGIKVVKQMKIREEIAQSLLNKLTQRKETLIAYIQCLKETMQKGYAAITVNEETGNIHIQESARDTSQDSYKVLLATQQAEIDVLIRKLEKIKDITPPSSDDDESMSSDTQGSQSEDTMSQPEIEIDRDCSSKMNIDWSGDNDSASDDDDCEDPVYLPNRKKQISKLLHSGRGIEAAIVASRQRGSKDGQMPVKGNLLT